MSEDKVVYKELSYKIVGILFEVFNDLGEGYQEKHYEKMVANYFEDNKIKFKKQAPFIIKSKNKEIGRYYFDFLVEDKIILELKKGDYFSPRNIKQVVGYLKATGLKLGILANFTSRGVMTKRILNIK